MDISEVLKFLIKHHCYAGIYYLLFSGQEVVCEEPSTLILPKKKDSKKIFRITKKKKDSIHDFRFKFLDFQDLIKLMFGRYQQLSRRSEK